MVETEIAVPRETPVAQRSGQYKDKDPVGLKNLGNTGWMNTGLQCILGVKELTFYFLEEIYKADLNTTNILGCEGRVAQAYATLVENLQRETTNHTFVPRDFMKIVQRYGVQFGAGRSQADAQEFLGWLLDSLDQDLSRILKRIYVENPVFEDKMVHDADAIRDFADRCIAHHKARNDSIILDLFQGIFKSTLSCLTCKKVSISFDPFSIFSLDPIQDASRLSSDLNPQRRDKPWATLEECFTKTCNNKELLPIGDEWFCPGCSEYRRAFRTLELWTVPDILIIHMKKFPKPGVLYMPTEYPIKGLDLSSWVTVKENKSLVYDLFSVVSHRYGAGGRGYYSAFVKNFDSDKWHEYDGRFKCY